MKTILIVDDLRVNLELLEVRLEESGYRTVSALNGIEALEILASTSVDLIISDILMPGMDGYALCRACKKDDRLRKIPFVFYTATYTDKKDEAFALSLGAEGFIIKPSEKSKFMETIEQILDQYKTGSMRPTDQLIAENDEIYFKDYNARLVAKLEKKIRDLEAAQQKALEEHARAEREIRSNLDWLESLLNISQYRAESLQDLLDFALTEAVKLTHSQTGYIYFCDLDKKVLLRKAVVPKDGMLSSAIPAEETYQLEDDALPPQTVLRGTPLLMNDTSTLTGTDKIPASSVSLPRRALTVPVAMEGVVLAVVGVLDKDSDYDETDVRRLQLLMDEVWRIKCGQEVEQDRLRLLAAVEQAHEGIAVLGCEGESLYTNSAMRGLLGGSDGTKGNLFEALDFSKIDREHINEAVNAKTVWTGRIQHRFSDASPVTCESTITPIQDTEGNLVNVVMISRDITEELKLEDRIRQTQKMEAIGTLAGGIAHDFNNILSGIMGYAELSMLSLPEDDEVHGNMAQLLTGCERARDLVGQILAFSRQTEQDKKPTCVLPIISEVCKFLRASMPASIQIVQKFQTEEDLILADPTQFHQVLMNLCTNSGHAMREIGGVLEISTGKEVLHHEDALQYGGIGEGAYLRITVRDTGYGIPTHIIPRIFEPYFTTKDKSEGTGLGLAVVHGIVSDHGGGIKVYSEEGKGTAFHLLFPLLEDRSQRGDAETFEEPRCGSETILVVDDEEGIRQFVKKSLECLGYVVVTASSGPEGLSIFQSEKEKFDLVITDKTMSRMSGFVLAESLLKVRPDIPILMCTGFVEKNDYHRATASGIRDVMMKPMRTAQLAAVVRKTLDSRNRQGSRRIE